jgi:hypothetical protein
VKQFNPGQGLQAMRDIFLILEALALAAFLGEEDALRRDGGRNAGAPEGKVDACVHRGIGRRVNGQVRQPVAYRVETIAIAVFEVVRDAVRLWLMGHTRDRFSLQGLIDRGDNLGGLEHAGFWQSGSTLIERERHP